MNLYEVAVAAPLRQTLTYAQPEGVSQEIDVGTRVLVPLGNRFVTGYIIETNNIQSNDSNYDIKNIVDLPDPYPLFSPELVHFYRWISSYYHYPIGEVIRTALPGGLDSRSGKQIRLTSTGRESLTRLIESDSLKLPSWVGSLLDRGFLSPVFVRRIYRKNNEKKFVLNWKKKGWILIIEEMVTKSLNNKEESVIRLAASYANKINFDEQDPEENLLSLVCDDFPKIKKSELKTLKIISEILASGKKNIPRADITHQYSYASKAIHSLCEKNIICLDKHQVYRNLFGDQPPFFEKPEKLTEEQDSVLATLEPAITKQGFKPYLLHGVTGCGKTEVYLRAARTAIDSGRSVLILVPEIALATQLEAHFYSRFQDVLAVFHSGLSSGQRHDQWQRILEGKAQVVLGTRSAVFTPLKKLGLVIVDEEHEPAYKQDDGLRYNGRDLAIIRAQLSSCPVILGSATPSITSYYNAKSGKYTLLTMKNRVYGNPLPEVKIIDLQKEKKIRPDLLFSNQLINSIRDNLKKGQQSLLFLNRRGFAGFMLCRDCGHIIQCKHCKVSLTLHKGKQRLVCHYCGYSMHSAIICPKCNSIRVTGMGLGSERVEEETRLLFPEARIARLDSDTTTSRKKYLSTLKAVRKKEVDILVGTQMIAKGLHFPQVTLVGIILADSGLGVPDFRASERAYQIISQVTGRAGRGDFPGRVIIQTHRSDHHAIRYAQQHAYEKLYEEEMKGREALSYPPFTRLVNVRITGNDQEQVVKSSNLTASFLRQPIFRTSGLEVLGPAPSPLARIKDRTRWQLLLKARQPAELYRICEFLIQKSKELCKGNTCITLDIDPENMM